MSAHVYVVGLQLSLTNQSKEIHSFSYACLPGVSPTPLNWKPFCKPETEMTSGHVTYYQLTESDESVANVVEKHFANKPNVVGLVIINFTSSNFLSNEILKGGIPNIPPIYVVSCEDGEHIVDLDAFNVNEGDLKIRVQVSSDSGPSKREIKSMSYI